MERDDSKPRDDGFFAGLVIVGLTCAMAGSAITWALIVWWPQ